MRVRFPGPLNRFASCSWLVWPVVGLFVAAMALGQTPGQVTGQATVLTSVRAIRNLPPEEAARQQMVRLEGVVTVVSGWKTSFFLEDKTGGIAIDPDEHAGLGKVGKRVRVEGLSDPGLFAPSVTATRVTELGPAELPPAPLVGVEQLYGGRLDGQWVSVRGVIRSAGLVDRWGRKILALEADIGQGTRVVVHVLDYTAGNWQPLLAATVRMRGVAGTIFNDKRQFVGLRLFVSDLSQITVEQAAPADPYALPLHALNSLFQFGDNNNMVRRIRIRGLVSYAVAGVGMYLQAGQQGVFVRSEQTAAIPPGTEVEAVGYPAAGNYAPALEDAVYRVVGQQAPPQPLELDLAHIIYVSQYGLAVAPYDAVLVRLSGRLVEVMPGSNEDLLFLQSQHQLFTARLPHLGHSSTVPDLGSLLEVTGICVAKADLLHDARSFELQLRDPGDLQILNSPPWWTLRHAIWIVIALLAAILVLTGLLAIQRRQHYLHALAVTDELTGLYNRRGFLLLLEHQWQLVQRNHAEFLLFYLDIDQFKRINDTYGHKEGDRVLVEVAEIFRECFRSSDILARVGGDEFAIVTDDASPEFQEQIRSRLDRLLERRNCQPESIFPLELSVGVLHCTAELGALSIEDLLGRADVLMYLDKHEHRQVYH